MWNRHNVKILLSKEEISVLIEHHQAQADAAWESGERAAEGVLRRLGVLKDPVEPKPAQRPQRKRS